MLLFIFGLAILTNGASTGHDCSVTETPSGTSCPTQSQYKYVSGECCRRTCDTSELSGLIQVPDAIISFPAGGSFTGSTNYAVATCRPGYVGDHPTPNAIVYGMLRDGGKIKDYREYQCEYSSGNDDHRWYPVDIGASDRDFMASSFECLRECKRKISFTHTFGPPELAPGWDITGCRGDDCEDTNFLIDPDTGNWYPSSPTYTFVDACISPGTQGVECSEPNNYGFSKYPITLKVENDPVCEDFDQGSGLTFVDTTTVSNCDECLMCTVGSSACTDSADTFYDFCSWHCDCTGSNPACMSESCHQGNSKLTGLQHPCQELCINQAACLDHTGSDPNYNWCQANCNCYGGDILSYCNPGPYPVTISSISDTTGVPLDITLTVTGANGVVLNNPETKSHSTGDSSSELDIFDGYVALGNSFEVSVVSQVFDIVCHVTGNGIVQGPSTVAINCNYRPTAAPSLCPTLFPTHAPSTNPTTNPSNSPTKSPTFYPSTNPSACPTKEPTALPSTNPTFLPSTNPTVFPTKTPSAFPSREPTACPSMNPTLVPTTHPTKNPTRCPSMSPTREPTRSPTTCPSVHPSMTPSLCPTKDPSDSPSVHPTHYPSTNPTLAPSKNPSMTPSVGPTAHPSMAPTLFPTSNPSTNPTLFPTHCPSTNPTHCPSANPTFGPTANPSSNPTFTPTFGPTSFPSTNPTFEPSSSPTLNPTSGPTREPTVQPSASPSSHPTTDPSSSPSAHPTAQPSVDPTLAPSKNPTLAPTASPSANPTLVPTSMPSINPTHTPSNCPSLHPTNSPSVNPTNEPTLSPTIAINVTFDGNYYTQIGNRRADFLAECNDEFIVSCLNVFPGSIIVTFAGLSATLDQLQLQFAEEGLDLPSFPLFLLEGATHSPSHNPSTSPIVGGAATVSGDDDNDDMMTYIIYGCIGIAVLLLCVVSYCYCKAEEEPKFEPEVAMMPVGSTSPIFTDDEDPSRFSKELDDAGAHLEKMGGGSTPGSYAAQPIIPARGGVQQNKENLESLRQIPAGGTEDYLDANFQSMSSIASEDDSSSSGDGMYGSDQEGRTNITKPISMHQRMQIQQKPDNLILDDFNSDQVSLPSEILKSPPVGTPYAVNKELKRKQMKLNDVQDNSSLRTVVKHMDEAGLEALADHLVKLAPLDGVASLDLLTDLPQISERQRMETFDKGAHDPNSPGGVE